jgi:hypothetical protein
MPDRQQASGKWRKPQQMNEGKLAGPTKEDSKEPLVREGGCPTRVFANGALQRGQRRGVQSRFSVRVGVVGRCFRITEILARLVERCASSRRRVSEIIHRSPMELLPTLTDWVEGLIVVDGPARAVDCLSPRGVDATANKGQSAIIGIEETQRDQCGVTIPRIPKPAR